MIESLEPAWFLHRAWGLGHPCNLLGALQARGAERSTELSAIVNDFILRRTNTLLSAHLPPKVGRTPALHVLVSVSAWRPDLLQA